MFFEQKNDCWVALKSELSSQREVAERERDAAEAEWARRHEAALASHAKLLGEAREEHVAAVRSLADRHSSELIACENLQESRDLAHSEQISQLRHHSEAELSSSEEAHARVTSEMQIRHEKQTEELTSHVAELRVQVSRD